MFWKMRAWRVDVATDGIALCLEFAPQSFLGQFTVGFRIPAMNTHASKRT
jgi:hypothetical protein